MLELSSARALKDKPLAERVAHNTLVADADGETSGGDESGGESDLVVRRAWIPYFNIQYYLGVDGISLSLVVLTGFVRVLACLASWNIEKQVKGYYRALPVAVHQHDRRLSLARPVPVLRFLRGDAPADVFPDRDLGRAEREYAAIKFLLYTLFGSVFILVAS